MHSIFLMPPIVEGQSVTFPWRVEPESALYSKTSFTLTFPVCVDLCAVPGRLWWDIFLICLHPHWLLLRPCQIHLPLRLPPSERQFWLQLLQNGADTLAAYGPERLRSDPLGITIIGGELDIPRTSVSGFGFGTSFSSGKDSLLQAALLCELTERPLLVTTTSPLPPLADHETERRRTVLAAIQERRNVQLVEVHSDFRSIWDNGFAGYLGYPLAVNELTDTFLYMSSLLAAGTALGKTRLFLASEAEVQVNAVIDGRIVQHKHFMYSAATQRSLGQLLVPYGIRFGSLTWPLYSIQVQQLLWARYSDLCDLQYSCWRVRPGEATCSECEQCFRIAMTALASGHNPERMGIDLRKVLCHVPDYVTTTSPAAMHSAAGPLERAHGGCEGCRLPCFPNPFGVRARERQNPHSGISRSVQDALELLPPSVARPPSSKTSAPGSTGGIFRLARSRTARFRGWHLYSSLFA